MQSVRAWRRAPAILAVACFLSITATSCLRRSLPSASELASRANDNEQVIRRVFNKLIGREPGPNETTALMALDYPELVDAVLNSRQFDQEGFFHLHRERLQLNREGTQEWVKNSYDDYCALKLEMAERSAADREDPEGYWNLLRYRERWVPIADFGANACFFATDIRHLLAAYKKPSEGRSFDKDKLAAANDCWQQLRFNHPYIEKGAPLGAEAFLDKLFQDLQSSAKGLENASLLATATGEKLLLGYLHRNLFPDFVPWPASATPLKDLRLELVKQNGRALVVQELGSQGNQQCLFKSLNNNEAEAPSSHLSSSKLLGIPDRPVLFPTPAAATQPGLASAMAHADGTVFIKLKLPKEFMGLHSSPYWLSRHPSKPRNRNLRRARLIYLSYLCTEVNPDVASTGSHPLPAIESTLQPYFALEDSYVTSSANCYECHTRIQPLANFFGLSSYGRRYELGSESRLSLLTARQWTQFINQEGAFDRAAGLYDGVAFFPKEGSPRGMEGLAHLLENYPPVQQCLVASAWAALVGKEVPLGNDEQNLALQAFGSPNEPLRLNRLLKHLMTQNQRGVEYFIHGNATEHDMTGSPSSPTSSEFLFDYGEDLCPDTLTDELRQFANGTVKQHCATCHTAGFIDGEDRLNIDSYFSQGNADDTPRNRGNLWQQLYCKVSLGTMPPNGRRGLGDTERQRLACALKLMRDEAAASGRIPSDYQDRACQAVPTARKTPAHAVRGRTN